MNLPNITLAGALLASSLTLTACAKPTDRAAKPVAPQAAVSPASPSPAPQADVAAGRNEGAALVNAGGDTDAVVGIGVAARIGVDIEPPVGEVETGVDHLRHQVSYGLLPHVVPGIRASHVEPLEIFLVQEAEILADYPDLEPEDLRASHAYAARLSRVKRFEPLPAA